MGMEMVRMHHKMWKDLGFEKESTNRGIRERVV